MFDFQKLVVYTKAKEFTKEMLSLIDLASFDKVVNDQLKRASLSIILNIAEGSSRFSNKDRHFIYLVRSYKLVTTGGKVGRKSGSNESSKEFLSMHYDVVKLLKKDVSIRNVAKLTNKTTKTVQKVKNFFNI